MKELSIEEKAKRYDDRLEKARKWYDANTNEGYKGIFEDIFPELKESEDERIRKVIADIVKAQPSDSLFNGTKEKCLAWLEKQGEQKPAKWEPQRGDTFRKKGTTSPTYHLCDKREDGITFGFVENREVGIAGGEITIFALKNDYELVERPKSFEDVVEEELNKALQTKGEQKPAWSEEDETALDVALWCCKQAASIAKDENDMGNIWYADNWLKSLKERCCPQNT